MRGRKVECKTCSNCGYTKPITDFYKRAASVDGLQAMCKSCSDEVVRRSNARQNPVAETGIARCATCETEKPLDDFFRNKRYATGRHHVCKDCMRAHDIAYKTNPANKEKINAAKRRLYHHNRSEKADRGTQRRFNLPRNWVYDDALAIQGGGCAICGRKKNFGGKRFAVDHCHGTNIVRGLLCTWCNQALGQLQDSVELLRKAIAYLENPPLKQKP